MTKVLELCSTPPANAFVEEKDLGKPQAVFPLELFFCEECAHVQLLDIVDPKLLFTNYVYVSGTSSVFVKHFEEYAEEITRTYVDDSSNALVVDIGANDGTLLREFQALGMRVLGVDPACKIAARASEGGIETLNSFFTQDLAVKIHADYGAAHIITANNVFAHVDDLNDIMDGIRILLAPEGLFVFEVSYLLDVIQGTLFDTIYHEHLAYHSLKPLQQFFKFHGMEMISAKRMQTHGGSVRGIVQFRDGPHLSDGSVAKFIVEEANAGLHSAETFAHFGTQIDKIGEELIRLIKGLKETGNTIAGFGAPAKATTLMYHFGINSEILDFIVDDSSFKQGLYSPGTHIPVLPSSAIYSEKPDVLLILAWNFANSIIRKHAKYLKSGGTFIVPLPKIEIFQS